MDETKPLPRGSKIMLLAIYANEDAIMSITANGDIAVVVFEATGDAAGLAGLFGWDGLAPVFRLGDAFRRALADGNDPVIAQWVTRETAARRVLLLARRGSLLLNGNEDGDWWTEPGQLDPLAVV